MHHLVGFGLPFLRAVDVHPIAFRDKFLRAFVLEKFEIGKGSLPTQLAIVITNLVLQNSAEPAADGRLTSELFETTQSGKKSFLDEILGELRFADAHQRITI